MKTLLPLLFISMLMAGCATDYVTIHSQPAGAMIYHQGVCVGRAPWTFDQKLSSTDKKAGFFTVSGLSAKWVSGCTQDIPVITFPITGDDLDYTIQRPSSGKNEWMDFHYGLQVEQTQAMKDQAQAQDGIKNAIIWGNIQHNLNHEL